MTKESLPPGCHVIHTKTQVIGTVIKEIDDFVCVRIAKDKHPEVWKMDELTIWNGMEEIQRGSSKAGVSGIYF